MRLIYINIIINLQFEKLIDRNTSIWVEFKTILTVPVVAICGALVTVGGEAVVVGIMFGPDQAFRLFWTDSGTFQGDALPTCLFNVAEGRVFSNVFLDDCAFFFWNVISKGAFFKVFELLGSW